VKYVITNTAGRSVQTGVVPGNGAIGIQGLVAGQYVITVGEKGQQFLKR